MRKPLKKVIRMSIEMDFDEKAFKELMQALEDVSKTYPDYVDKMLKKEGEDFKERVKDRVKTTLNEHTGNLTKGFRLGPVQNIGGCYTMNFMAEGKKNPHWHLVEKGHEMKIPYKRNGKPRADGGRIAGFVPGKHIVRPVLKEWDKEHGKRVERVLEKMKEDGKL